MLGTALWLVVAGIVEGFVTPRGLGPVVAVVVGLAVAAPYWALLVAAGLARRGFRQAATASAFRNPTG